MTELLDLTREITLDTALQFPHPVSEHQTNPKAIFLSGASGFFGAYLLDELLRKTTADIYCLMRCQNNDSLAQHRLKEHLRRYCLWQEKFAARIIVISGDLSLPLLGLSPCKFKELAEKIDLIYHNGAWVNGLYPYAKLKATNVDGTVEILRLAGMSHTKPVHFVSTVAVFFSAFYNTREHAIVETDPPHPDVKGGYKQTKWVAENLVQQAQQRGLPVTLYRTGRLMGHSTTGITHNFNDLLISLIKACLQIKLFPEINTLLSLVPVDFAAQSLVYLSQQTTASGHIFHLLNPQPIAWNDFFRLIKNLGYPLEKTSLTHWQTEIQRYARENKHDNLFNRLRFSLNTAALMHRKPAFDIAQTLQSLANTDIHCAAVNQPLVALWIAYLQKCAYIQKPD